MGAAGGKEGDRDDPHLDPEEGGYVVLISVMRSALSSNASTSCSIADSRTTTSPGFSVKTSPPAESRNDPDTA
jgi:hypothetical protein